jgi:hypothetical protein
MVVVTRSGPLTRYNPDGHAWEVAWNPDWTIGDDGSVSLRKRGR